MYICLLLCLERFDIILFTKSNEALTEWVRREKRARTLFAYVVSPHKMHKWQTAHSTVVSCESSAGCRLPFCPIDNPKIYYRSALTKHIHQNIVYTHASIPNFFEFELDWPRMRVFFPNHFIAPYYTNMLWQPLFSLAMEMQQEQHGFDLNGIYPGNGSQAKRKTNVRLKSPWDGEDKPKPKCKPSASDSI